MSRLLLDARPTQGPLTGIARYTRTLWQGLAEHDDLELHVLLQADQPAPDLVDHAGVTPHPIGPGMKHPANHVLLPRLIRSNGIDHFVTPDAFAPRRCPCRSAIVIHDLIPLTHRYALSKSRKSRLSALWRAHLHSQAARADAVLTVSQHSRRQLIDHLELPPDKLHVVHPALEVPATHADADERSEEASGIATPKPPHILAVGRADPYKNLVALVEAHAELLKKLPDARLTIVGPLDDRYPEAQQTAAAGGLTKPTVTFTGTVSDEELERLYREADVLAFPSLAEGFGLPPLEAMARGLPVVAHPSSAAREVLDNAALFANATQPGTFARALERVLTEETTRNDLITKGHEQATKYTPAHQATALRNALNI